MASPSSASVTHPGFALSRKLEALAISPTAFANAIGLAPKRVKKLIKGKKDLSPGIALRVGRFFGEDPESWLMGQVRWDIAQARASMKAAVLAAIKPVAARGKSGVPAKSTAKPKTKPARKKATKRKPLATKQHVAHEGAPIPSVENPST